MVKPMKTAIVTGASKGIGRSLVSKLCSSGWRVIGVARDRADLEELTYKYPGSFGYIIADLSEPRGVEQVAKKLSELDMHTLDLLVNNAGAGLYKRILDHSIDEIERIVYLNFIAPLLLTKTLLPFMNRESIVVYVVSAIVHVASKELPVYGAAKLGLHYAIKILRGELAERGIHVLTVYPGYVKTRFHASAGKIDFSKGVTPDYVAEKIIEAIQRKKKVLYVPIWVSLARVLGPYLPII